MQIGCVPILKIVIINGSPRNNGATAKILQAFNDELLKYPESKVAFYNLKDMVIKPCQGCCACYKTGSCYINDDAEKLSNEIEQADGVIIGSPTYASNVSGLLKNYIDRGHFVIEQLLSKKYAICIATGENYGNGDTINILSKLVKYSGAALIGKIRVNIPFNSNADFGTKIKNKISILSYKMVKNINNKAKYRTQAIIHRLVFSVGIKPFVLKKGAVYSGVLEKWQRYGVN